MNKKYQVFISSTYTDLLNERQAAVEAILKAGHIPAGMELFAAGNEAQMETIKRWIEASDIYMVILGGRYGSLEPKTGLSYIELEYDYATELNKPIFAVVVKDETLEKRVKERGRAVIETEHPQEYKAFRQKVLGKTSAFFEDPKDIKLSVHESIADIQLRCELKGWVSATEIPDTEPLFTEIKRISAENSGLLEENEYLKKQLKDEPKSKTSAKEFDELIKILREIKIESTIFGKTPEGKTIRRPLLEIFYLMRDPLVTGVSNRYGAQDWENLLYYNVCPKLQIHGLMVNEKVPGVQYRRFGLTKKGLDLLAYIEKNQILREAPKAKNETKEVPDKKGASTK
jgi:hypothetical protein